MAYVYEDEDENELMEEEEMEDIDLDDDLNGIQTTKEKKQPQEPKKKNPNSESVKDKAERIINQDVPIDEKDRDYIMNNLLLAEVEETPKKSRKEKKEVSTDDLLSAKDNFELTTDNMITTKDEKYFKAYIGKNYYKLTHKKFNWAAFFLGPVYLLYRKVYTVGAVWLGLNVFVSTIGPLANANYIVLLIFLLLSYLACGYFANSIYLNHVGTRIVNFKIYDNSHVKEQCLAHGGTNEWLAMILIGIYVIIGGVFGSIYGLAYYNNEINKANKTVVDREYESFDGKFEKDDTVVMENIVTFNGVEKYYKSTAKGESSIYYVYENPDLNVPKSTMELSVILNHNKPKLFIEAVANYEMELVDNVKEVEVNGLTWYYINTTNANKNIIYASTLKNGKIILFKFVYDYTIQDTVLPYFDVALANIF